VRDPPPAGEGEKSDPILATRRPDQFISPEETRLPAELSASVRQVLKPYILERVQHSPFLATTAWEWYGALDKSLISKHGIAPYFNMRFVYYDRIDGVSLTAIRSSSSLNVRLADQISRRKASNAMVSFGMIGFSTWPLPKHLFRMNKGEGFELWVWDELLKGENVPADVMAGNLFAMMAATELQGRNEEESHGRGGPRARRRTYRRDEIIQKALEHKGMQKLRMFPSIRAAVAASTLFK
jgi:hypothetical protein